MADSIKYEKAASMSLEEALGTEPVSEDSLKISDDTLTEVLEAHKLAEDMLRETDKHLEEYIAEYEKNGRKDRENVEMIYCFKIALLQSMARRFHPFSAYGKEMLKKAVRCREEFEDTVGPLITLITENNIELFNTVLSEDIQEDIITGRKKAIGALRTHKKTTYGVGAVAYHIEEMPGDENGIPMIDWLFVNAKFRQREVANHLLGEIIYRCGEAASANGKPDIITEFPSNVSDKEVLGYLFSSWGFDLGAGLDRDTVLRVRDIIGYKKIASNKAGVKSLSDLPERARDNIVLKTLRKQGYEGFLLNSVRLKDYYIPGLSCYMGQDSDPYAMLLMHKTPSGIHRVEYIGTDSDKEEAAKSLISFMLQEAVLNAEDDTLIKIPVDSEEVGEYLEEISPKQLGNYLIGGRLNDPFLGEGLSTKTVNELINGLS